MLDRTSGKVQTHQSVASRPRQTMKTISTLFFLIFGIATAAQSTEIATCRNPSGTAYFHFGGLVDKAGSGWHADKITSGVMALTQSTDGSFDILYFDTRKVPVSSIQDGGVSPAITSESRHADVNRSLPWDNDGALLVLQGERRAKPLHNNPE